MTKYIDSCEETNLKLAMKFIAGKLNEEKYVAKHPRNSKKLTWVETVQLRRNPRLFSRYCRRFVNPVYRRRAVSESIGINQKTLMTLLHIGASTASSLIVKDSVKLNDRYIADFALYHRITYEMANNVSYPSYFTTTVFMELKEDVRLVTTIKQLLDDRPFKTFGACVLRRNTAPDIHLRWEFKNGFTILDIIMPEDWSVELVANELAVIPQEWYYFELPSIFANHSFTVFITGGDYEQVKAFIQGEFKTYVKFFKLSSIRGG